MSAKYKNPSFLLPNELNTSANTANNTGINSLYSIDQNNAGRTESLSIEALNLGTTNTISMWLKFRSSGYADTILGCPLSSAANTALLFISSTVLRLQVGSNNNASFSSNPGGQPLFPANEWKHMVITKTGTTLKLFIDGVYREELNPPSPTFNGNIDTIVDQIGSRSSVPSSAMRGKIDEVSFYTSALTYGNVSIGQQVSSDSQIAKLYNTVGSNVVPSNLMATDLNPIAYYPLGEQAQNSGYFSASGNTWQFPNGVLQDYVMGFDGVNDFIDCGNEDSVNITGAITVSAWIKPNTSSNGGASIVSKRLGFPNINYELLPYSTKVRFYIGSENVESSSTLQANVWTHLVGIFRPGQSIDLYWNGSITDGGSTSTSTTTTNTVTNPLIIGSNYDQSVFFNGSISNVAIWNSDQTANIDNIYNNGSPQTTYTVTPQNWWKLNADSVYTPSAPNYTTALSFNSTKTNFDKVTVGDLTALATPSNDITISLWAKLRTIASTLDKYGMPYSDKSGNIYLAASGGGSILKYESNLRGTSGLKMPTGLAPSEFLKWHHVVVTFSGTEAKLYYNGVLEDTGTAGSATNFGEDTTIGTLRNTTNNTYSFNGFISNVAVLQSALSASQVSTLFNFGTPETTTSFSPIHNWKLDNLTNGLNDTGSLASNNGTAGASSGSGPVQESTSVAVVPSWKIPSALPITTPNYTKAIGFPRNSNDRIDTSFNPSTVIGDNASFTISSWVRPTDLNNFMIFMGSYSSSNNRRFYLGVDTSGGSIKFGYSSGNESISANISLNVWQNIILVYDNSASVFYAYVNGQLVGSHNSTASAVISTANIKIGTATGFSSLPYGGDISNLAIYDSPLSQPNVSTIYNNGTPQNTIFGSPVAWWKLDNITTITDSSGNGYTGTIQGSISESTTDVLANQPVNGVSTTLPSTALQQSNLQFDSPYSNYSLYFDGALSRVQALYNLPSGVTKFSVSIWGNVEGAGSSVNKCLISNENNNSADGYALFTAGTYPNTKVWFKIQNNTSTQTTSNIVFGEWFHVLGTYDNGTAKIYFNGVLEDTTTGVPAINTSSLVSTMIGSYRESNPIIPMLGHLDEAAIWETVALTDAQVLQIYNNGKPNDISSLSPTNWWRLGENAYFNNGNKIVTPNSIIGGVNGIGSGTVNDSLSANAPGTYSNGIGTNLAIIDRVGDAPLSIGNSQSYNMIPDDKTVYVPGYVGTQITNAFEMTFDGVNDYFNTGTTLSNLGVTTSTGFSFSTWIYISSTDLPIQYDPYLTAADSNWNEGWALVADNAAGGLRFFVKFWNQTTHVTGLTLKQNAWNHVVGVAEPNQTVKLYLNNADGSTSAASSGILTSIRTADINKNIEIAGETNNSRYAPCKMDEVAIFNTALSADQIQFDLYKPSLPLGSGKTADIANNPNLPTPVAWYRMGD